MRMTIPVAGALAAALLPTSAAAQIDMSDVMAAYAQEDAVMEAAREQPRARPVRKAIPVGKTRAQCAKARRQITAGMRDPRLTQLTRLCRRGGY